MPPAWSATRGSRRTTSSTSTASGDELAALAPRPRPGRRARARTPRLHGRPRRVERGRADGAASCAPAETRALRRAEERVDPRPAARFLRRAGVHAARSPREARDEPRRGAHRRRPGPARGGARRAQAGGRFPRASRGGGADREHPRHPRGRSRRARAHLRPFAFRRARIVAPGARAARGVAAVAGGARRDRGLGCGGAARGDRAGGRRPVAHADPSGEVSVRRALPVALWLLALALCAVQVARTRFVADLSSFLPAAPTPEQRLLVDELREGAFSRVMILAIEGSDAATRARLSRALAARLAADPRFASVQDGAAEGFARDNDFAFAHRYALSPEVNAQRFGEAGLRAAISDTISLLASPAGALVKPLVLRDPTGETLALLESLRPAHAPRSVEGVWASPDATRALLVATTRAGGSDIDGQALAMEDAHGAFDAAVREIGANASAARLLMTGPGVLSVRSRSLVKHDVERFSVLGLAIVATLLLLVYRSPLALTLGLVPVATGALVGIAAVSLGFGVVHGITLGFGTTLIGEAVDYSIYLFVQAGRGERAGDA